MKSRMRGDGSPCLGPKSDRRNEGDTPSLPTRGREMLGFHGRKLVLKEKGGRGEGGKFLLLFGDIGKK